LGVPVPLDGVHVRYFPSRVIRRLYWSPPLARALQADISRFTVVHLHSVFLWPTWVGARLARQAQIPYLISPRGMLVRELIERENWLIKLAWIKLIEKTNLESASVIHATSSLEARELQRFGWRLPKIATIPNGLDEVESFAGKDISPDVKEIASEQ